jgi:hypothetical protein
VQPSYAPGTPMTIVLEPTLYGLPVALDPPVRVTVRRPDLIEKTVGLVADPDGSFSGVFADTGLLGPYLISAEVSATTPLGNRVTRYRHMTGIIFRPGSQTGGGDDGGRGGGGDGSGGDGDGGWTDEDCKAAHDLLRRLDVLIKKCCAERSSSIESDEVLLKALTRRLSTTRAPDG